MAKADKPSYQVLAGELDDILAELQQSDLDVDVAVKKYERGLELIKELEKYLSTAENRVTELKAKFSE
ncbi:MAG TPA: exodeoxyribonuclease VII small subunit [Candidatus Saccharimonadales bacterium]|nr:exodeoxyribonuclease VII small subunit [Candidatus Saccharimonadales bacterium]